MGNYLDIIRQVEEDQKQTSRDQPVQAQNSPAEALPSTPGDRITRGTEGTLRGPATVSTALTHQRAKIVTKEASPTPVLQPGWLVVYLDRQSILCGGCDDRQHGTVQECRWENGAWTVHLTDGQRLPLAGIRSVGKVDEGKLIAAWTVREHGHDGMKGG